MEAGTSQAPLGPSWPRSVTTDQGEPPGARPKQTVPETTNEAARKVEGETESERKYLNLLFSRYLQVSCCARPSDGLPAIRATGAGARESVSRGTVSARMTRALAVVMGHALRG